MSSIPISQTDTLSSLPQYHDAISFSQDLKTKEKYLNNTIEILRTLYPHKKTTLKELFKAFDNASANALNIYFDSCDRSEKQGSIIHWLTVGFGLLFESNAREDFLNLFGKTLEAVERNRLEPARFIAGFVDHVRQGRSYFEINSWVKNYIKYENFGEDITLSLKGPNRLMVYLHPLSYLYRNNLPIIELIKELFNLPDHLYLEQLELYCHAAVNRIERGLDLRPLTNNCLQILEKGEQAYEEFKQYVLQDIKTVSEKYIPMAHIETYKLSLVEDFDPAEIDPIIDKETNIKVLKNPLNPNSITK